MSILLAASLTLLPSANEAHVEMVQTLVTRLSPEIGKPIEVDRTLAGLPVYVERRSMTATETLDSVAFGLRASLVKSEKGWRLTRTDQDKEERLRATRAVWRDLTERWIALREKNKREAAGLGDRQAQISHYRRVLNDQLGKLQDGSLRVPTINADPYEFTPAGEFYLNLIKALGTDKLVESRPEARRTWSNRPLPGQLVYPRGDALLQAYDQAQQRLISQQGGSPTSTPARFTFQQTDGVQFRLAIYDEAGRLVESYGGAMVTENMAGPVAISFRQMAKPFESEPNALRPLDGSAKGLLRFLNNPGGLLSAKDQVPAAVHHPDQVDPLDLFAGPGFAEVAQRYEGKGFVIVPTDDVARIAQECVTEGKINVAGFRHILEERAGFEKTSDAGVTVFRPRDPFRAEVRTVDRLALASQTRLLLKRPRIEMTDIALAFYRVFPAEQSIVAEQMIRGLVLSQPRYRSSVLNNLGTVLALFGAAFEASGKRTRVAVEAKNDPFRRLVNRCVNHQWLRFESAEPVPAAALDAAALVDAQDYQGKLILETSVNPALAFLGVKPDANATPERVSFQNPQGIGAMLGHNAAHLPQILYPGQKDKLPKQDEVLESIRKSGRYHVASQDQIYLDLYAKAGIRASFSLQQTRPEKTFVVYDNLSPQCQKALLDAAMKAIDDIGKPLQISGATFTPVRKSNDPPKP